MSEGHKRRREFFAELQGITPEQSERRLMQSMPCSENGWAIASLVFARARGYWYDFFDLDDVGPLCVWGHMFDGCPLITPDIAEQAVDAVYASGDKHPHAGVFYNAAKKIVEGGN